MILETGSVPSQTVCQLNTGLGESKTLSGSKKNGSARCVTVHFLFLAIANYPLSDRNLTKTQTYPNLARVEQHKVDVAHTDH